MHNIEPRLLWSPWLRVDTVWWEKLFHLGQRCFFKKGSVIIKEGQYIQHLYYLRIGEIKTTVTSAEGLEKTIWYIQEGCVFGETPLFNDKPCVYVFSAILDCEVYLFSRETVIQEIIPKHPEVVLLILSVLTRKVHVLSTQVEDLTFRQPMARVSRHIYLLAYQNGKQVREGSPIPIKITQQDLANMIGVHRVTVNNVLRKLEDEGVLQRHNNTIVIKDIAKLETYASLESKSVETGETGVWD